MNFFLTGILRDMTIDDKLIYRMPIPVYYNIVFLKSFGKPNKDFLKSPKSIKSQRMTKHVYKTFGD